MRAGSASRRGFTGLLAALTAGLALVAPATGAGASVVPHALRSDDIITIVNDATGKCLDMTGGSKSNGAQPQLWTCNGSAQQRWEFVPVVGNYFLIVNNPNPPDGDGKCLSILNNDPNPGGEVIQYNCDMSGNDHFELWTKITNQLPNLHYQLANLGDGLDVMQPSGCGTTNGTKMFMNFANNCSDNVWH